jgi:hypothetical protein
MSYSKYHLNIFLYLLGVLILMGVAPKQVGAEVPPRTVDNPKPAGGDLLLPLPGDGHMVFRRARVPGTGFWGSRDRIIQIGDASGGIFEGLQRTQISGSFPAGEGDGWEIVAAKYELTRGQYIAVMGMDKLLAVSKDPEDQKLPTLKGRSLRNALMRPLTYVSHQDILEFIRTLNGWLFDPDHPERIANMPRLDGVPGFVRILTEDEWEFCARGGVPAMEAGTFDDRLPFPAAKANEHAWHLGNAKHRLRPIGLRAPGGLGLHDMFGNAQEMTAGLFRPEIWQGKPGGVAVRGGSVSTPAKDLRSSFRAELDVYAWDRDTQTVQERRSFNTGVRLAIGSNVVTDSAQRARIEKEYEAYKADLRKTMPVGRTLDNLVSQASVQIGAADPVLARIMKENPDLRGPLAAVQDSLSKARERLELAQRESARSLAQDAARNGVNLSVYLSRMTRLTTTLKTARELAAMSSRYQEQVAAVEKSLKDLQEAADKQLQGYRDKIATLGEYELPYIEHAFARLEEGEMTGRERETLGLLKGHAKSFAEQRRADLNVWMEDFREKFKTFKDS